MFGENINLVVRSLAISVLLIIIGQIPGFQIFKSKVTPFFGAIEYGLFTISSSAREEITFIAKVSNLKTDLRELETENLRLQSQLVNLGEVERENGVLRNQLQIPLSKDKDLVFAKVIGRGGAIAPATLRINVGKKEGVNVGDSVVLEDNLVGIVSVVNDTTSIITLITNEELKIAAIDKDSKNRARGVVKGQYSTVMIMEKIFREEEINEGDIIITSGENGMFPKGLVLGKITTILTGEDQILRKASVVSLVDIDKLEEVFVIKK